MIKKSFKDKRRERGGGWVGYMMKRMSQNKRVPPRDKAAFPVLINELIKAFRGRKNTILTVTLCLSSFYQLLFSNLYFFCFMGSGLFFSSLMGFIFFLGAHFFGWCLGPTLSNCLVTQLFQLDQNIGIDAEHLLVDIQK